MADLSYGSNPGCIARVSSSGGTPGQCGGQEAAAVLHRYQFPRPHDARLYVCERHAQEHPAAEALTDDDRQVIAERHARSAAQLERAGRSRRSQAAM